jgi:hypothetical protein
MPDNGGKPSSSFTPCNNRPTTGITTFTNDTVLVMTNVVTKPATMAVLGSCLVAFGYFWQTVQDDNRGLPVELQTPVCISSSRALSSAPSNTAYAEIYSQSMTPTAAPSDP